MNRCAPLVPLLPLALVACSPTQVAPTQPTWADVEPIIAGECAGCHGPTAKTTGSSYRLDFYEMSTALCGDAALALDSGVVLAGTVPAQIGTDIVVAKGARWPKMPPLPSPQLADWETQTLERWSMSPVKGPPPPNNHLPTITTSLLPATAKGTFSFTADVEDADGDPVLGVIEVGGYAFLMNRPGAFAVSFDASSWPAGTVRPQAVLCDGWANKTYDLGPVTIQH
jgi:mono/diheme cytochrome c family protein